MTTSWSWPSRRISTSSSPTTSAKSTHASIDLTEGKTSRGDGSRSNKYSPSGQLTKARVGTAPWDKTNDVIRQDGQRRDRAKDGQRNPFRRRTHAKIAGIHCHGDYETCGQQGITKGNDAENVAGEAVDRTVPRIACRQIKRPVSLYASTFGPTDRRRRCALRSRGLSQKFTIVKPWLKPALGRAESATPLPHVRWLRPLSAHQCGVSAAISTLQITGGCCSFERGLPHLAP
jgi:hypothetical protein